MIDALKRSIATFIFATTGALLGAPVLDMDVASWKVVAATGIGALVNLAYRASERWLKDNPEDGQADVVGLLVIVILVLILLHLAGVL